LQALVFKLSEVYEYTSRCGGCRIYHRLILLALLHSTLLVSLCFLQIPIYRSRFFLAYIVCGSEGCVTGDFDTTNIYKHSARPVADPTTLAGQQEIHLGNSMKWSL
jgi:hypothetical protein